MSPCALLRSLAAAGVRAVGMKPVAAGFDRRRRQRGRRALDDAGNVRAPLRDRNPYAFADAVAPHLAAEAGWSVDRSPAIVGGGRPACGATADVLIVEGAGGALVPLDARHDMLDIAAMLELPVLLVVGMRLGCLNHALLSALAIRRRGLELRGWIANRLPPPMPLADRNIRTLAERLGAAAAASIARDAARFGPDVLDKLGSHGARSVRSVLTFAAYNARVDADARFFRAQFPRARREQPPDAS